MSATTKIAVGVAGGYLLGRTKKLRLALTLGSMLAGQRLMTNQRELVGQGLKAFGSNPELQRLRGDVSGRLRDAALGVASSRMERLTDSLRGQGADEDEAEDEAEDEPEDESADDVEDEEPQDEPEEPEEPEPPRAKKSTAKKAPAKKAPAKKAPAKKTAAKKTSAKKTPARSRDRR